MKFTLLSLALAASLTACGGGGQGTEEGGIPGYGNTVSTEAPSDAARDCTVLLAGDSVLAGANMTGKLTVTPAQRLREAGFAVTDASVAGTSVSLVINTFEQAPVAQRFAVLEWFTNDVGLGLDPGPGLQRAVAHVQRSGKQPVLSGAYALAGTEAQRAAVSQLAQRLQVPDAGWGQTPGEPFSPTDNHPSQTYSDQLTQLLVKALRKLAPECK